MTNTVTQIPGSLPMSAEAVGMRIRMNKGKTPNSVWVMRIWDQTEYPDDTPPMVSVFATREDAIESYLEDMQEELGEIYDDEPAVYTPEQIEASVNEMRRIFETNDTINPDQSYDGMFTNITEQSVWGSRD